MGRSANGGAAPTSAGADTAAPGGGASGAGARQKGRPQRPANTSTPAGCGLDGPHGELPVRRLALWIMEARPVRCRLF